MNCTYTLRKHIETLDKYRKYILKYGGIDYYRRVLITNKIQKRINNIKEYLNIDYKKPKKKSIRSIVKDTLQYIGEE